MLDIDSGGTKDFGPPSEINPIVFQFFRAPVT